MSTFDLCELKPPPEPDKPSASFAKHIQELKNNNPAYQDYVDLCLNSSTTNQPVTQTSTTERSTAYNTTLTDFNGTTSVTNFPLTSPTGLNTNNQLDSGEDSSTLVIIVILISILILIAAVILGVFLIRKFYRKKERKTVSRHVTKQGHGDIAKENKNVAATRYSKTLDGNNEFVQVCLMDEKSKDSNNVNIDSENNLSDKGGENKEIETDILNYHENNSRQGTGMEGDITSGQYNTNHGFTPDMDVNVDSENNFSNSSERASENKETEMDIHNYNENNSQQGIGTRGHTTSGQYNTNRGFTPDTDEKLHIGNLQEDKNSSADSNGREEGKQVSDKNSENPSEDGKLSVQKPEENEISPPSIAFQNESLLKDKGSNEEHLPIKSDSDQNNESPATDVKIDEKEQSLSSPVNSSESSTVSESGLPKKPQDQESLKSDLKLPLQQSEDVKNVDHQISTESGYGSQMSSPLTPEITVIGSPQVYSLQTHEETNYVHNKVENSQMWKGHTGNSNTETDNQGNGKTEDFVEEEINYLHNKKVKGEVWKGNLNNSNGYHSNIKSECNSRRASGHEVSMKVRPMAEPARVPDESKTKPIQDTEAIYMNHQFEKLAKKSGQGNPSKEKTNKVKPILAKTDTKYPPKEESKMGAKFPHTDMETSEMFIIDENPYDKVDFKKPQQSKPVPTKRKTKQDEDKQ